MSLTTFISYYPLTAPAVTPATIFFCINMKKIRLGIMDITMPGSACSQSELVVENFI